MKARYQPILTRKERDIVTQEFVKQVHRSTCRAQWLMIIAFNEVLGIGAQRVHRVLDSYAQLLTEFHEYEKDGVEEEMMINRLHKMGLDVKKLWE